MRITKEGRFHFCVSNSMSSDLPQLLQNTSSLQRTALRKSILPRQVQKAKLLLRIFAALPCVGMILPCPGDVRLIIHLVMKCGWEEVFPFGAEDLGPSPGPAMLSSPSACRQKCPRKRATPLA